MKFLSFLKTTFITIFCLFIFLIVAFFVYAYTYNYHDKETQNLIISEYSISEENFYTDNDTNTEIIKPMNEFISSLPVNVSNVFNRDWIFVVADELPSIFEYVDEETSTSSNDIESTAISGYSDWHARVVFIQSQNDINMATSIFIHELGHCFDYEFGSLSSTNEFKAIYLSYKDTFIETTSYSPKEYAASSPAEFFATIFKEYFLSPTHLKEQAPEAYDFLDVVYKEVSQNPTAFKSLKYDLQSVFVTLENKLRSLQTNN